MKTKPWQSPEAVAELYGLGRPGFAFEFLRRNRTYRRDYKQMVRQLAHGETEASTAHSALARRWGLQFCPRP